MVVRGICIRDSMPSCIRAPPEATNRMKGRFSATAASAAWTNASPTAMPSEPPRKSKGCTAIITGNPSSVPRAAVSASGRPVLALAPPSSRRHSGSRPGNAGDRCATLGGGSSIQELPRRRYRRSALPGRRAYDARIWGRHRDWRSGRDGRSFRRRRSICCQRFSGVSRPPLPIRFLILGRTIIGDPVHAPTLSLARRMNGIGQSAGRVPSLL